MSVLFMLFFSILCFAITGILLLIFVRTEPASLVTFITFAIFTLIVNAIFMTSLPNHAHTLKIAAYICGGIAICTIIIRILFQRTEQFAKVLIVITFIASTFGAFFI